MFTVADYSLVGDDYLLPRKLKSPLLTHKKSNGHSEPNTCKKASVHLAEAGQSLPFSFKDSTKITGDPSTE